MQNDPQHEALIAEVGTVCPCGIDLTRNGCYRGLRARGATWTCSMEDEQAWHGSANPYLQGLSAVREGS